jgi:hypothetical protein
MLLYLYDARTFPNVNTDANTNTYFPSMST